MSAIQASTDGKKIEIDRSKITPMLLKMFELWRLTTEEKLAALGLSTENRAALTRYKKGEAISASRDMLDRAGNLLAIHKDLRLLFPSNPEKPISAIVSIGVLPCNALFLVFIQAYASSGFLGNNNLRSL